MSNVAFANFSIQGFLSRLCSEAAPFRLLPVCLRQLFLKAERDFNVYLAESALKRALYLNLLLNAFAQREHFG